LIATDPATWLQRSGPRDEPRWVRRAASGPSTAVGISPPRTGAKSLGPSTDTRPRPNPICHPLMASGLLAAVPSRRVVRCLGGWPRAGNRKRPLSPSLIGSRRRSWHRRPHGRPEPPRPRVRLSRTPHDPRQPAVQTPTHPPWAGDWPSRPQNATSIGGRRNSPSTSVLTSHRACAARHVQPGRLANFVRNLHLLL
jgi:hypothetical protein